MIANIAVTFVNNQYKSRANRLAEKLNLPVVNADNKNFDLVLYIDEAFSLIPKNKSKLGNALCIDFLSGKTAHRYRYAGGQKELIAKAIGLKKGTGKLNILDTTAGLGQDAFVLASLGCQVTMLERSPIIAALLKDALRRAKKANLKPIENLKLLERNSIHYLQKLQEKTCPFDVIFIDPMYPERKKSALPNKASRIVRAIVGQDEDAMLLLHHALACKAKRIVVKRPRLGQMLSNLHPQARIMGKSTRFDLYFPQQSGQMKLPLKNT